MKHVMNNMKDQESVSLLSDCYWLISVLVVNNVACACLKYSTRMEINPLLPILKFSLVLRQWNVHSCVCPESVMIDWTTILCFFSPFCPFYCVCDFSYFP